MNGKEVRHRALLRLVSEQVISTQAELRRMLASEGHRVDQATLSRDIRELGILKTTLPAGEAGRASYRYTVRDQLPPAGSATGVRGLIRSVRVSQNLVVVRTGPGNANPVALAIDRQQWNEVLGTVAGDDTLFLVVDESHSATEVQKKVERLNA